MATTNIKTFAQWQSDSTYQATRNALLFSNEGGSQIQMHFDTRGGPTIGQGGLLLAPPNQYHPMTWTVDSKKVAELFGSNTSPEYSAAMGKLQRVADILTLTKDPQYDGQSRTVSQFLASQRGQMLAQEFGTLDGKWHPAGWTLVVDTAALARLNEQNILDRERALNTVLRDNGLLNIQFTASQMAGLSSMVYQGNNAAAGAAAKAIAEGKTGAEICAAAAGANKGTIYANRFNAECSALTNGAVTQYFPSNIIKPLRRSDIDSIIEEVAPLPITASADSGYNAEVIALIQKRTALKNTLTELANNYEGENFSFTVTDSGLMLFYRRGQTPPYRRGQTPLICVRPPAVYRLMKLTAPTSFP